MFSCELKAPSHRARSAGGLYLQIPIGPHSHERCGWPCGALLERDPFENAHVPRVEQAYYFCCKPPFTSNSACSLSPCDTQQSQANPKHNYNSRDVGNRQWHSAYRQWPCSRVPPYALHGMCPTFTVTLSRERAGSVLCFRVDPATGIIKPRHVVQQVAPGSGTSSACILPTQHSAWAEAQAPLQRP